MTHIQANPLILSQIMAFVAPELRRASSDLDLSERLARMGYGFRDTSRGRVLTTLPHGVEIAQLPGSCAP